MTLASPKPAQLWPLAVLAAVFLALGASAALLHLAWSTPPGLQDLSILNEKGGALLSVPYLDALAESGVTAAGLWSVVLPVRSGGRLHRAQVLQITRSAPALLAFDGPSARELALATHWNPGACAAIPVASTAPDHLLRFGTRVCTVLPPLSANAAAHLRALGLHPDWLLTASSELAAMPGMNGFLGLAAAPPGRLHSALISADNAFRARFPRATWAGAQAIPAPAWIRQRWQPVLRSALSAAAGFSLAAWAISLLTCLAPLLRRQTEFAIRRALGATAFHLCRLLARETLSTCLFAALLAAAILSLLAPSLQLANLLPAALAGVALSALLFAASLTLAQWAWTAITAAALSARPSSFSLPALDRLSALLVIVQGASLIFLVAWAGAATSELRYSAALRLNGDLRGVVGLEAFRPMQDSWLSGSTEAEVARNFAQRMRLDLAAMQDTLRPFTRDGKVGAIWPRNWEDAVPLSPLLVPGSPAPESALRARIRFIAGDALEILRLPLLQGHGCSLSSSTALPPALANEAFLRSVLPGRPWQGAIVSLPGVSQRFCLTGLVASPRPLDPSLSPIPELYLCDALNSWVLIARPAGEPSATAFQMLTLLQTRFPEVEGSLSLPQQEIETSLAHIALLLRLTSSSASLTLALLLLTLWAALSLMLTTRARELAVRIACGASPLRACSSPLRWLLSTLTLSALAGALALHLFRPGPAAPETLPTTLVALAAIALLALLTLWHRLRRLPVAELLRRV